MKKRKELIAANIRKSKIPRNPTPKPQQYKASLCPFADMWELNRYKLEARPNIKEKLKQTDFWPLIEAYDKQLIERKKTGGKKSDMDVAKIMKWYDWKNNVFKFGNGVSQVTTEDVVHIFGLKNQGVALPKSTLSTKRNVEESRMIKTYFRKLERVKKEDLKEAFTEAYKLNTDRGDEDVALIIVMYLLMTLLLANSGVYLPWCYIKCCESIEGLNKYNFAEGVKEYLFTGLKKAGKTREEQNLAYFPTISGCVVLIMLWICERSGVIEPVTGNEQDQPAAVRWNLITLHQIIDKTARKDIKMNNAIANDTDEDSEEVETNEEESESTFQEPAPAKRRRLEQSTAEKQRKATATSESVLRIKSGPGSSSSSCDEYSEEVETNEEGSESTFQVSAPAKRRRLEQSAAEKQRKATAPSERSLRIKSCRGSSSSSSETKHYCFDLKKENEKLKTKLKEAKSKAIEARARLRIQINGLKQENVMLKYEVGEQNKQLKKMELKINELIAHQERTEEERGKKAEDEHAAREHSSTTPITLTEAGENLMQLASSILTLADFTFNMS